MREIFDVKKLRKAYSSLTVAWVIFLTLTACGHKSSLQIERELSDIESEALTRGDDQGEINRDWNIYLDHLWKWDDKQIEIMLKWAQERSAKNKQKYNKNLEERNKKLQELDEAKAREARAREANGSESVRNNYPRFDENELMNSNSALVESIRNRNN